MEPENAWQETGYTGKYNIWETASAAYPRNAG